ncbi:hypothetical protein NIES267_03140 [Calothrix parasitica NIES-267]|uniref:Transposase n=1 Tax=Calothrix parasitica NIES-267 TaxID=1973488 RepID=A0A1Z4LI42_9CYAN|nr:hypothetical protein NIES267_03140 [Calothrix parasitica NIES-267]
MNPQDRIYFMHLYLSAYMLYFYAKYAWKILWSRTLQPITMTSNTDANTVSKTFNRANYVVFSEKYADNICKS